MHITLGGFIVAIKTPSMPPLFSERNGYMKPLLSIAGYRLFILKRKHRSND